MRRSALPLLIGSALLAFVGCDDDVEESARSGQVEAYEERLAAVDTETEAEAFGRTAEGETRQTAEAVDRKLEEAEEALQEARNASDDQWQRSREEIDEILSDVETQLSESSTR